MAPKKKGKNGFFYYMQELRQDEAARGNQIRSMDDLQLFASPRWDKLSVDEKEEFNRRAKEDKLKGAGDMERKYNSLGVSFAAVDGLEREQDEQEKIMKATIKSLAMSLSPEALTRKPFYLCHVNYYYLVKDSVGNTYQPAEIALAEFTLEDGLIETRHFVLSPGKIPLGMKADAQTWADKTHGIRLVDKPGEEIERERNFVKVYGDIVNFLKKDAGIGQGSSMVLPVIYSMPDSLNNNTSLGAVKSALSFLSGCANERRDLFRVYPLPELFFQLWKKYRDGESVTVAILENEIEKDVFSCAADLGCEMHERKDLSLHCSLSIVKRWVFTVCDITNLRSGIPTIPGCHAPVNADVEWSQVESSRYSNSMGQKAKRFNPEAKVGYVDPPPQKSPLKFDDLSKLQELRIREKEDTDYELSQAESLPPPMSAVYRGAPLPPNLSDKDFPPIGGMGGGRGAIFRQSGSSWPISARGRRQ